MYSNVSRVFTSVLTYKSVRVTQKSLSYDIQSNVADWDTAGSLTKRQTQWPTDSSAEVVPNPCHSHNDYLQKVPLYDALAADCTGVGADAWLQDDSLLIGHEEDSLSEDKTLQSLYIDPLVEILTYQNDPSSNPQDGNNDGAPVGIYNTDPKTSVVLMIDIKSDVRSRSICPGTSPIQRLVDALGRYGRHSRSNNSSR